MVVPNYYLITERQGEAPGLKPSISIEEYVASIESIFLPLDITLYSSAQIEALFLQPLRRGVSTTVAVRALGL